MTSDFLADLDAAVDSRCACLCGCRITAASPSACFASEGCATNWHSQQWRLGDLAALAAQLQRLREFWRQVLAEAAKAFSELAKAFTAALRELHRQVQPLLPAQPPTDLRARALWLHQHRNTGPAALTRAPRAIGPPAGFTTLARSRTPWRPLPR